MSILGPVRPSHQMCTLHQELVLWKCLLCSIRGPFVENSMTSGKGSSNGSKAEKNHVCFPQRSLPPVTSLPSTIDFYLKKKILYGRCMFSTHTQDFKKRNELWINSWCATVTLSCSDVLRFSVWVKTIFKSNSG